MRCAICDAPSAFFATATVLRQFSVEYFRCPDCHFVQTETPHWLDRAYAEPIAASDVGMVDRNLQNAARTSRLVHRLLDPAGRFLDFGGGYGLFVRRMRDLGYDFRWADPRCPNLFAQGHEGDPAVDQYELVTTFEVVEHLPDPVGSLGDLLKATDTLLVSTELMPASEPKPGEWWYYALDSGQHVSLFGRRSLEALARRLRVHLHSNGTNLHLLARRSFRPEDVLPLLTGSAAAVPRPSLLPADAARAGLPVESAPAVTPESAADRPAPTVVIDGVFFSQAASGIARVWASLLAEWGRDGFGRHVVLLDRGGCPRFPGVRTRTVPPYDPATAEADRARLQAVCDEERAGVFASTYFTTPLTTPSVLLVHDLIPERFGRDGEEPVWREKERAIRQAARLVCVSRATARDLHHFYPDLPAERTSVALCGVSPHFRPTHPAEVERFRRRYGVPRPYYLLVGTRTGWHGYKNAGLFFRAFRNLPDRRAFDVVCVGGARELEPAFRPLVEGVTVHRLALPDPDLKAAYAGAVALVYPSKWEGFGLPVVEAMAVGCPVVTGRNGSLPEVAGDAARFVDVENPADLATALTEVRQPAVRHALQHAGWRRAGRFSWPAMARDVQAALLAAARSPGGVPC